MTYGKMLKLLKDSMEYNNFEQFTRIFFDERTGEMCPFERVKDFCAYWLQKDIHSYKDFRNKFAIYRNEKLRLLDAITVICSEDVRKKINPIIMLQFRILVLNYTDAISTTLNLAEMLVACCSDLIEQMVDYDDNDGKK